MRDAVEQLRAMTDECAAVPVWSLGDDDLAACLDGVHAAEQALATIKLHLIRQAEIRDLPAAEHAPTCAMWLRHRLRISIQAAKRLVELARDLDRRPELDAALGAGELNTEQAQVIAATIKDLPAEVGVDAITEAENMLIGFAGEFEPLALRKFGARILAHVAPEVAEKAEAVALARQEARAHAGRGFTLTPSSDGRVRISGWLDRETAAVINAALDPLCTPLCTLGRLQPPVPQAACEQYHATSGQGRAAADQHGASADRRCADPERDRATAEQRCTAEGRYRSGREEPATGVPCDPGGNGHPADGGLSGGLAEGPSEGLAEDLTEGLTGSGRGLDRDERRVARDERTPAQRRADALVEVCRLVLAGGQLPDNGGERPQVVVTVPFDVLRQRLGAATLDTGERLSAGQVRRLACDARVIPAVLGGDGQVLDVGSSRRLFTGPLRRALVLRDGGCAFPLCDRHPRWCQGHHVRHWSDGGPTTLDNGVLLCGVHHRVIHQGDWTVRLGPDRRPEFVPPSYLDPDRRPRRNIYHRACAMERSAVDNR